jgi:DNA polymerase III delta prime subunit
MHFVANEGGMLGITQFQSHVLEYQWIETALFLMYRFWGVQVIELPIKHPELFESLGVAQPKGVLLYGPPGTGKTLLARAVAHHTDCTFIRVSGSELVQKYIGEGSRMVRELFVMARYFTFHPRNRRFHTLKTPLLVQLCSCSV